MTVEEVAAVATPETTVVPTSTVAPVATPGPTKAELVARLKPTVVQTPVTYGSKRRAEMAKYSERHYGTATARLKDPKVIVVHYTVTPTFQVAFDIFDSDAPDAELGERPGVCAHFLIDKDGTIHQLVPLTLRCRHTVGLNWTSIGIEHVGSTDASVIDRAVVRRSSLRLVRWLRCRYGIKRSDVIGHSESLSSPYHRENVEKLRTQTHADMQRATMNRYRKLIKDCP